MTSRAYPHSERMAGMGASPPALNSSVRSASCFLARESFFCTAAYASLASPAARSASSAMRKSPVGRGFTLARFKLGGITACIASPREHP